MTQCLPGKVRDWPSSISRSVITIADSMRLPEAIKYFSKSRGHIAVVVNQKSRIKGVIALEDAVETLLGWEIVDEFDPVPDMRDLAPQRA